MNAFCLMPFDPKRSKRAKCETPEKSKKYYRKGQVLCGTEPGSGGGVTGKAPLPAPREVYRLCAGCQADRWLPGCGL